MSKKSQKSRQTRLATSTKGRNQRLGSKTFTRAAKTAGIQKRRENMTGYGLTSQQSRVNKSRKKDMKVPVLNPLVFYQRFPHITEQIFKYLDKKSLTNCSKVSKSWKNCIDGKKLLWIQIVNIPTILKDVDTYLHVAAKTGQLQIFEMILPQTFTKNDRNLQKFLKNNVGLPTETYERSC